MVQAMKAALMGSRSRLPTRGQMETTTQRHSEPLQHQATYTATNMSQASSDRDQALVTRAEFKTSMEGMIASIKADLQNTIMSVVREIVQKKLKAMITPILHEAEVGGVEKKIAGYNIFMTPTIRYKKRGRPRKGSDTPNVPVANGQAAVFVDDNLPQDQIDMSQWCNGYHEIVAVLVKIGARWLAVVSVYERPGYNVRSNATAWIPHLKLAAGKVPIIMGGDFNATHTMWGYSRDSPKGEEIADAMTLNCFRLVNDVDMPTRIGMHAKQKDTTPDLTWATRNIELEWQLSKDCMGSDHLPITVRLTHFSTGVKKRVHKRVKWDKFREALTQGLTEGGFTERLQAALKEATQDINVKEGDPTPDSHLLNLWASRIEALERYKKEGKPPALRAKLNLATATAKRYANQLARQQWQDHCDFFNSRTGLDKMWRTFQAMQGRKKSITAAQNIALALRVSEDQVAAEAGPLFFLQPATPAPQETYKHQDYAPGDPASAPFTMGELISPLRQCKTKSTPGPDGITYALLRNLPDEHSEELLTWINQIWTTGQVPEEWKTSWVNPIPKPGKPKTQEEVLQEALHTIVEFLDSAGMSAAPNKTSYIVVGNRRIQSQTETQNIRLTMKGDEIQRVESLRILGLFLDQDGRPHTWMKRVTKTWKSTLHLIRRVATKKWGATERVTRTLALALLTSKALYAYNYNRLTQTQVLKLERLNREAMRVISGLPRLAKIEDLRIHSKLNTLKERADALKDAQLYRLKTTEAGRAILRHIGYATDHLPTLPNRSLEDTTMQLTTFAPLARNMGKDYESGGSKESWTTSTLFESTAEISPTCTYTQMLHCEEMDKEPLDAELQAILAGANHAATHSNKTEALYKHVWVFTDSREAHAECDKVDTHINTFLSLGRTRRRKTLTDLVPQDPDGELPAEYSRSDRVILRRILTNTAITPALQTRLDRARRVQHPDDPGPVIGGGCTRCGS
ncbi:hypothetical protein HPB47_012496 [Ixodes persulcatus]|uniref:Uncharacterized protein n=1 Tax=Ixodes persulcatus TaxID=34615 RepID=A0AC60NTL8_IXOPE|nr:hypothetical protein HPB47_012496 [Ixodes persulcatus]